MLATINEGSKLSLDVDVLYQGVLTAPATLRYRVDCKTTAKALAEWTTVTPSSSVLIDITPTTNAIQNVRNAYETKAITLEANTGTDEAFTQEQTWRVKNLQFIT